MKPCVKCGGLDRSPPQPGRRIGDCSGCARSRTAAHRAAKPAQVRAATNVWRSANAAHICAYGSAWRTAKRPDILAYGREWRGRNKEHRAAYTKENGARWAEYCAHRRAVKLQATPLWLTLAHRQEMTDLYAFARFAAQEVDHIVPLAGKHVCGLHVPWNLQLLPPLENRSKGNRHGSD